MLVNKRILSAIGILATLTLGLIVGVTVPSLLAMRDISVRIDEEREKLDTRYALRIFMRDAETKMSDVNARLRTLSSMAITEGKELAFITALEEGAAKNGVTQSISLVTANQKDLSPWEKEIPLSLVLSGAYPDILEYLRHLETMPYAIDVHTLDIDSSRKAGPEIARGEVDATIQGVVRWHGKLAPVFIDVPAPSAIN